MQAHADLDLASKLFCGLLNVDILSAPAPAPAPLPVPVPVPVVQTIGNTSTGTSTATFGFGFGFSFPAPGAAPTDTFQRFTYRIRGPANLVSGSGSGRNHPKHGPGAGSGSSRKQDPYARFQILRQGMHGALRTALQAKLVHPLDVQLIKVREWRYRLEAVLRVLREVVRAFLVQVCRCHGF